jgi:hypothetical protein
LPIQRIYFYFICTIHKSNFMEILLIRYRCASAGSATGRTDPSTESCAARRHSSWHFVAEALCRVGA